MERQRSLQFVEPICDTGITMCVLNGVINQPAAVTFCGAILTTKAVSHMSHSKTEAYQVSMIHLRMRKM